MGKRVDGRRVFALGLGLVVSPWLSGCFGTFSDDPYGWSGGNAYTQNPPPRYGHGGTQSPSAVPPQGGAGAYYPGQPGTVPPSQYSQNRGETIFLPEPPPPNTGTGGAGGAPAPGGNQQPSWVQSVDSASSSAGGAGATSPPPQPQPEPEPQPAPAPDPAPAGDLPVAARVPGQPNYVYSPFSKDRLVDVEGIPSGTEVECPYTHKHFLVP